jgi:hypothetical protein
MLNSHLKTLQELGGMRLEGDQARFEKVIDQTARAKKVLADLARWVKAAQPF